MAYAFRAVAPALDTLLAQLNALAPRRSKLSDGALGDTAHAARFSFHNPNADGVVQARDFTHDVAGGLDCNWLAAALIASGDKRIHEIIWNRRYWTPTGGWVPYTGSNPHDKHLHLTVRSEPKLYNSTAPWQLAAPGDAHSTPEDWFDMATQQELIDAVVHALRTEGVAGAGDAPLMLDRGYRQAMHDATASVLRSEGVSGAGDTGRLVDALSGKLAAGASPAGTLTEADIAAAVREVFADAGTPNS
jgi:hypothetical protein